MTPTNHRYDTTLPVFQYRSSVVDSELRIMDNWFALFDTLFLITIWATNCPILLQDQVKQVLNSARKLIFKNKIFHWSICQLMTERQ